jgi:hypothetical protein
MSSGPYSHQIIDGKRGEIVDIYEKAGVKKDDVVKWAHATYPQFENNEKVILQLYLKQVKKVEVPMTAILGIRGQAMAVSDIQLGKYAVLEGLIGPLMRDSSYTGCPLCSKKVDGGQCREHGPVDGVILTFNNYVFGDNTGDIEISLGPKLVKEHGNLEGAVVKLSGKQKEDGTFTVSLVEKIDTPDTLKDKQSNDVLTREVTLLKEMASKFPSIDLQSIQLWHNSNKLQTPVGTLINAAGIKLSQNHPAPAPAAPVAPAPAEVPAEVPAEDAAAPASDVPPAGHRIQLVDQKEKEELTQMKKLFKDGVKLSDLTEWHKGKKMKSKLEDLIFSVGARVDKGMVIWQ